MKYNRKRKLDLVTPGGAPTDGPHMIPVSINGQEQILFVRLPDSIVSALIMAPFVAQFAAQGRDPAEAVRQATPYFEAMFKTLNPSPEAVSEETH